MGSMPRKPVDRNEAKLYIGKGWHRLIDEAYDILQEAGVYVVQIKEKFGQLRIYTQSASDDTYNKIAEIEYRSGSMCETCGAPSKIHNRGGWLKSICDPCLEKLYVQSKART